MSLSTTKMFYPDRAIQVSARIEQNVPLARDTYRVRFAAPEIARRVVPGQFVMVRLAGYDDPLIGRPLALYDTVDGNWGTAHFLDVVYVVGGKMTRRLAQLPAGHLLDVWGPLGNGFPPQQTEHLIMVAGGIGQTPFLALAKEHKRNRCYGDPPREVPYVERITLCYGARSADRFAGVDDFLQAGVQVRLSTDDGTAGHHGLVTEVLQEVLTQELSSQTLRSSLRVVCCGPEAMMCQVARIAFERQIPCQVSLESPMACGIGICFSCVAKVRQDDGTWDYRRTCIEGPVFDAQQIVW